MTPERYLTIVLLIAAAWVVLDEVLDLCRGRKHAPK